MSDKTTPKITKPKAEGDKRRKGKKNLNWKDDPEILVRLSAVSEMIVKQRSAIQIAQDTKVSLGTAKRDIARVKELWKEEAHERVINSRDLAIAQYSAEIKQGWEDVIVLPVTHPNRPAALNIILRAQERIDKVTGIGGDKVEHSGPNGGPIPVEVADVEAIRKRRWKQIAGSLAELTQENNAAESTAAEKP